jgi:hypothetical protein
MPSESFRVVLVSSQVTWPRQCRGFFTWQGRDRLVSHRLQPDQEATRHGGQPEVKANQTPSGSQRPHGSSLSSLPTLNTETSRRRACCGLAHLKDCLGDCLGNRSGERTIRPFVRRRHLYRIKLVAEQTLQLRASARTRYWHHPLPAVQTACHSVHGDLLGFTSQPSSGTFGSKQGVGSGRRVRPNR